MAEFPALPLWTDAYLADTGHLTYEEHGLYLNLLVLMWRSPGCRIPNDDLWLGRRFGEHANAMRSLCQEFCVIDENWIWQKRLQKEWQWCKDKKLKNTEAANTRWLKTNNKTDADALFTHSERNAPIPTPTPIKKVSKIDRGASRSTSKGSRLIDGWKPSDEGRDFAIATLGEERALAEFDKFTDHWRSATGQRAVKADWEATWRNWCRKALEYNGGGNGRVQKTGNSMVEAGRKLARLAGKIADEQDADRAAQDAISPNGSDKVIRLLS